MQQTLYVSNHYGLWWVTIRLLLIDTQPLIPVINSSFSSSSLGFHIQSGERAWMSLKASFSLVKRVCKGPQVSCVCVWGRAGAACVWSLSLALCSCRGWVVGRYEALVFTVPHGAVHSAVGVRVCICVCVSVMAWLCLFLHGRCGSLSWS